MEDEQNKVDKCEDSPHRNEPGDLWETLEKRPTRHVRITGTQQIHVEELSILYLYGNVRCCLH